MSSPSQPQSSAAWIAGRYRIERPIAEGGMGSVYAVRDEQTGATLALKRARGVEQSPHLIELFEREYRTLASLSHPRIIRVHDYGVDGGSPFYTMDLVQGRDLHELAPLPLETACRYLRDVATCLALLHARRLLHRDITPRNVRVTPDDRCTLLDFGALTSFGIPDRTVGTPPFIPPEALGGAPLDQRADLFAFGALLYWTLTRKHAYRARSIEDLPNVWQQRVIPPSKLAPNIPEQADALILSLLSLDPNARPVSIADVVERLSSLCKLPPEDEVTQRALADSYLSHTLLVGRKRELEKLEQHVSDVSEGKGSAVIVHGPSGGGRTRLLRELVLKAQLSGVPSIFVDAAVSRSAYGTAIALLQRVLDASPEAAREAAAQAAVLSQLDASIAARLGHHTENRQADISGSWRARVQESLYRVFAAACALKPLLLAIDNADEADDPSLAVLAALRSLTTNKLVLALSSETLGLGADVHERGESFSWRVLRERCLAIPLAPFSLDDTYDLIGSVFGGAPGSTRLAQWLHQRCAGLPLHLVELLRKLHVMRVVRYIDGIWLLPAELPSADIPAGLSELLADRLNDLSPNARSLAEALAIQRRSLTRAACLDLAKDEVNSNGNGASRLLDELVGADILTDTHDGFRFTHGVLRNVLATRMSPERKRTLHMRGAEQALNAASGEDTVNARIAAGWHLLQAGEESRGADLLADVAYDTVGIRFAFADLQIAAPALAAALDVYSRQGRSIYERAPLLAALAQAGYYEDRRWALRYGEEALEAVSKVAGIDLARRLQPKLGKTLGLLLALATAFVRFKLGARRLARYGFADLLILLFSVVTTLTGVASIALDVKQAERIASTLDPFRHLPERLTPVGIRQFCFSLRDIGHEQQASALRTWTMLTDRFNDKRYYPTLPERARPLYIGGLWFARGVFESMRDGRGALDAADALDRLGIKLYRMIASELRMLHHFNRGEVALGEQHRAQVELHAIQIGSASQVEYFEPAALILPYTAMSDSTGARMVAQRLSELADTTPSLARYAELAGMARELARADLMVLGTKQIEPASELWSIMERALALCMSYEPRSLIGWAAALGFCARALNLAGRHDDALHACERVRAHMAPEDRLFVALFLAAELEHAVALAGVGRKAESHALLDELLHIHSKSDNPLTRGRIHEAVARVALIHGERDVFTHHLAETRSWFRATGTPSLIARSEALAAYARRSSMPPPEGSLRPMSTMGTDSRSGSQISESAVEVVTSARRVRRNTRGGISIQPGTVAPDTEEAATAVLPDDSIKS